MSWKQICTLEAVLKSHAEAEGIPSLPKFLPSPLIHIWAMPNGLPKRLGPLKLNRNVYCCNSSFTGSFSAYRWIYLRKAELEMVSFLLGKVYWQAQLSLAASLRCLRGRASGSSVPEDKLWKQSSLQTMDQAWSDLSTHHWHFSLLLWLSLHLQPGCGCCTWQRPPVIITWCRMDTPCYLPQMETFHFPKLICYWDFGSSLPWTQVTRLHSWCEAWEKPGIEEEMSFTQKCLSLKEIRMRP